MSRDLIALKFSIKANWVPFYINRKLIAGRIIPLHQMEEKIYKSFDDRGRDILQEYYYSSFGFHCDHEDKKLVPIDFLRKNRGIAHAYVISYNKTILLLGYNVFHYKFIETNPPSGIHVDYFSSALLNYPDNCHPKYLGNFSGDDTFYKVRGVGTATIAQACNYAITLHPKEDDSGIAVDLTARADEKLINELYKEKYGFDFYKGKRGKHNEMFLNFKKARALLLGYEKEYKKLERPEGLGLSYKNPLKF